MREEVERWWNRAQEDLETARANIDVERFYASAFFSHQAAEKALKALYLLEKEEIWKIHNLVTLAKELKAPEDVIESCDILDPHYIATRYPVEVEDKYRVETAEEAIKNCEAIMKWVKNSI